MTALVVRGDARALPLPDGSVDLIVTSPPFYALRSYQDGGEAAGAAGRAAGPHGTGDAMTTPQTPAGPYRAYGRVSAGPRPAGRDAPRRGVAARPPKAACRARFGIGRCSVPVGPGRCEARPGPTSDAHRRWKAPPSSSPPVGSQGQRKGFVLPTTRRVPASRTGRNDVSDGGMR